MNRVKTLYISAIIFVSIPLACGIRAGEDFTKVQSNFQVTGDGFHREMRVSSSSFPSSLRNCKIVIKWVVPSGIYVDPYQLQSSILNQTVHFSSHVNVEQMAHHAESFILHSFPNLQCSSSSCHFSQTIQFHLRYHLPSNTSDYTKVLLPLPMTYHSCDCTFSIDMAVNKCLWQKFSKPDVPNYVSVPVGDLSHLPLVTFITIAVAFMGTGCVAWASVIR
ncbi:hypothetical protein GHT06_010294 [Daphnia sinensis]|uniref:Phosphatidylinositol-glycan biosynthesis class X protein n=1 Tax=Daphnia sinensis TaxID=1820382 RepID=A0AAD5L067_9CRUS|nr:hypothetical protein GHT06_010294 [Daphnia sinensis]